MIAILYILIFVLLAVAVSCILRKLADFTEDVKEIEDKILLHECQFESIGNEIDAVKENMAKISSLKVTEHNLRIKHAADIMREHFADLRKTMSVREASMGMGISLTTGKRYERWRLANNK